MPMNKFHICTSVVFFSVFLSRSVFCMCFSFTDFVIRWCRLCCCCVLTCWIYMLALSATTLKIMPKWKRLVIIERNICYFFLFEVFRLPIRTIPTLTREWHTISGKRNQVEEMLWSIYGYNWSNFHGKKFQKTICFLVIFVFSFSFFRFTSDIDIIKVNPSFFFIFFSVQRGLTV